MNLSRHNPIIEISPATATNDILLRINPLSTCIGLLVVGEDNPIDCRLVLQMISLPCAGIAFVSKTRLRFSRRLTASMSLSRQYGCSCQLFHNLEPARQWLERRLDNWERHF